MKLEKTNQSYFVISDNNKELGSFQLDSNGYYYFWENSELTGCWEAHNLRKIADLLDEVNKPYNDSVNKYFDLEKRNLEDQARVEYRKLLNSGMAFEIYPQLTGVWKNDKNEWFTEYKKLLQLRDPLNF